MSASGRVKGKAKEVAGAVTGKEGLESEGKAQQDKADAQRDVAKKEAEAEAARAEAETHEARQRAEEAAKGVEQNHENGPEPLAPWAQPSSRQAAERGSGDIVRPGRCSVHGNSGKRTAPIFGRIQ